MAFGSSMLDADCMVVEISGSTLVLSDQYSNQYGPTFYDTALGGTSDLTLLGQSIINSQKIAKFKRKLNTGDTYDKVVSNGQMNMIWAKGNTDSISEHNDEGEVVVNFLTGTVQSASKTVINILIL